MSISPYIEKRKAYSRNCNCGRDHENKFIRGMFHYSETGETIFCVALLEHQNEKHIWLSFITGEWPGTGRDDCAVTARIYINDGQQIFAIANGDSSPFDSDDVFGCYQVTREQVLAVDGAKDWFINTYLQLFEVDSEIGSYLERTNA